MKKERCKIIILIILVIFALQPLTIASLAQASEDGEEQVAEQATGQDYSESETGAEGESGEVDGETVIETGDANIGAVVDNDINQNILDNEDDQVDETDDFNESQLDEEIDDELVGDEISSGDTIGSNASTTEKTDGILDLDNIPSCVGSTTDENSFCADLDDSNSGDEDLSLSNDNEAELSNLLFGEGNTGENEIEGGEGNSEIYTGDVDADSIIDNDVNLNETEMLCQECSDCETATSGAEIVEVENKNNASTTNDIELMGNSGENDISSTSGDSIITTGDINILNIIINYINNNIFGWGKDFFINVFKSLFGSIDLSGYDNESDIENSSSGSCSDPDCIFYVNNSSTTTLDNTIDINANSGVNTISSSSGTNIIQTGDISVVNDLVNIANLNITGRNWFFAVVNVFDVLVGDVILPAAEIQNGEDSIIETSEYIVTNSNFGDVINDINVVGDSGNNEILDSGTSTIITGDVSADLDSFNLVNYNFTGDGWRFVRLNVFGNWDGFIQGLPDGFNYIEDETGITIYNESFYREVFDRAFAEIIAHNENNAEVRNNINIDANTGNNSILHGGDESLIITGDIDIHNNLLNFINSNFTGNNWEFSMINIFGDWNGNLAFGEPELWVTEAVSTSGPVGSGESVTYTYLFGNNGDASATNVELTDDFNERFVRVSQSSEGEENEGRISWLIGELPPNSQGSLSYAVQVNDSIPSGHSDSENIATITSDENDRDYSNNTTGGSVVVDGGSSSGGSYSIALSSGGASQFPGLSIVKTNDSTGIIEPGDIVNFKITIRNISGVPLHDVLVADVMTDESGELEINRDFWNLETVQAGEEVIIEYSLEIKSNIESGLYINEAVVEGYNNGHGGYITTIASSKIKVENDVKVLGLSEGPQLAIGKISRSQIAYPGEVLNNKIIITNNGGLSAYDVVVTESLSSGLTFLGEDAGVKDWYIGEIESGGFRSIDYEVKIDDNAEPKEYICATVVRATNHEPLIMDLEIEVITPIFEDDNLALEPEMGSAFSQTSHSLSSNIGGGEDGDDNDSGSIIANLGIGAKKAQAFTLEENYTVDNYIIDKSIIILLIVLLLFIALYILKKILYSKKEDEDFHFKSTKL